MGIAQAIMENPNVLLLDEPMNALDEDPILKMRELFLNLSQKGTSILIASHNREDIDYLCHKIYKISNTNLVLET